MSRKTSKASADRAASRVGSTGFIGFDAFNTSAVSSSSSSSSAAEGASLIAATVAIDDAALPHDVQLALRRAAKRDSTTKLRALSELPTLWSASLADDASVDAAVRVWARLLPLLVADSVRGVRRAACAAHHALVVHAGRRLAPHLAALLPAWLAALFDAAPEVQAAARAALEAVFPSDEKRAGALAFGADALVAHLRRTVDDLTLFRSAALPNRGKRAAADGDDSAASDDPTAAALLPLVQALRAVEHCVRSLSAPGVAPAHAAAVGKWLVVLLADDELAEPACLAALFLLTKTFAPLRAPLFSLVATIVVHQRAALAPHVARIAAPVLECFGAPDAATPLREAFQATVALLKHFGAAVFGDAPDGKAARAVGAGLLTLLRQAGFDAPHVLYAGLQPLLAHLPAAAWSGGQAAFAGRVLAALWTGLDAPTWQGGNESMLYDAYIECLPLLANGAVDAAAPDAVPQRQAFVVNSAMHVVAAALAPADCAHTKWLERVAVVKRALALPLAPETTPLAMCTLLAPQLDAAVRKAAAPTEWDSPLTRSNDVLVACAELGAAASVQATAAHVAAQLRAVQPVSADSLAALARIARHFAPLLDLDSVVALAFAHFADAALTDAAVALLVACVAPESETTRAQWLRAVAAAAAAGPAVLARLVAQAVATSTSAERWRCAELTAAAEQQTAASPLSVDGAALLAACVSAALLPDATADAVAQMVVRTLPTQPTAVPVAKALLSVRHATAARCAEQLFALWAATTAATVRAAAREAFSPAAHTCPGVSIATLVQTLHAAHETAPCGELVRAIFSCAGAANAAAACALLLPVRRATESLNVATLAAALSVAPVADVVRAGARNAAVDSDADARLVRLAPLVLVDVRAEAFRNVARDWLWLPGGFAAACCAVGGLACIDVVGLFLTTLLAPSAANGAAHFSEPWLIDAVLEVVRSARTSAGALVALAVLLEAAKKTLPLSLLSSLGSAVAADVRAVDLADGAPAPSRELLAVALPFVAAHGNGTDAANLRACTVPLLKLAAACSDDARAATLLAAARLLVQHVGTNEAAPEVLAACEPLFGERWWAGGDDRELAAMVECAALALAVAARVGVASPLLRGELWLTRVALAVAGVAAADTSVETAPRATACVLVRALVQARHARRNAAALDALMTAIDDGDKAASAVHEPLVDLFAELVDVRDAARDEPFAVLLAAAADFVAMGRIAPLPADEGEGNSRVRELFMQFTPILSREDESPATLLSQAAAHNVLLQAAQQFAALSTKKQEDSEIVVDGDEALVDRAEQLEEQSLPPQLRLALTRANGGEGNTLGVLLLWSVVLDIVAFHCHNCRQHASAYLRRGERLCGVLTRLFDEVDEREPVPLAAVSVVECVSHAVAAAGEATEDARPFARLAARLFLRTALQLPVLLRSWYRSVACPRRLSDKAAAYVTSQVSEIVIGQELTRVQDYVLGKKGAAKASARPAAGDDDDDSSSESSDDEDEDEPGEFLLRVFRQARQVVAQYETDDIDLAVTLTLPTTYPLDLVNVESTTQFGVKEAQWRRWVLGITSIFMSQDGSVLDACLLWKENLNKHFAGVEPCPICYSVLHLTNNQLPKMPCANCKNVFHSSCLFAWFAKSHKSACPLCQSPF